MRSSKSAKFKKGSLASTSKDSVDELNPPFFLDPAQSLPIYDLADDAIISVNQRHAIVLFNHGAEKMFGYAAHRVYGKPIDMLLPDHLWRVHCSAKSSRIGARSEMFAVRKDGTYFPAEVSISRFGIDGGPMFTIMLRDITQRALAQERLQASLREKEVLLKEVHHRVKNNLQLVSSLLGLQARAIGDPATRIKFVESRHRVHSMALLHETLYQSDDLARIDFSDYIHRVTEQLFGSYRVSRRVQLRTDLEKLHLYADAAVPCGLILNELVSNSLKYGFPGSRRGAINVRMYASRTGHVELEVADDGVGLPRDIDWLTVSTLGLRLVRALVEQIRGTITVDLTVGTRFRITFPSSDPSLLWNGSLESEPSHG